MRWYWSQKGRGESRHTCTTSSCAIGVRTSRAAATQVITCCWESMAARAAGLLMRMLRQETQHACTRRESQASVRMPQHSSSPLFLLLHVSGDARRSEAKALV